MSVGALITWPYKAGGRSRRGSPKAGTTVQTFIEQTVQSKNLLMFQIDLALGSVRTQPSLNEFEIDVTLSLTSDKTKLIEFLDCFPCQSINQTWTQLSCLSITWRKTVKNIKIAK